jgi:hypothetical protein
MRRRSLTLAVAVTAITCGGMLATRAELVSVTTIHRQWKIPLRSKPQLCQNDTPP